MARISQSCDASRFQASFATKRRPAEGSRAAPPSQCVAQVARPSRGLMCDTKLQALRGPPVASRHRGVVDDVAVISKCRSNVLAMDRHVRLIGSTPSDRPHSRWAHLPFV